MAVVNQYVRAALGALELLSDPDKWTTNVLAQDNLGNEVSPLDPKATCWCLYGALIKSDPEMWANRDVKSDYCIPGIDLLASHYSKGNHDEAVLINDTGDYEYTMNFLRLLSETFTFPDYEYGDEEDDA